MIFKYIRHVRVELEHSVELDHAYMYVHMHCVHDIIAKMVHTGSNYLWKWFEI